MSLSALVPCFGQQRIFYRADLTAAQAGSSSNAVGEAILCLDLTIPELAIDIQLDGLPTSDVTACHIRLGLTGANGPRIFGLVNPQDDVNDFVDLGDGYESIWGPGDNGPLLVGQIAALETERLHFLLFTDAFPAGELRGQIEPVLLGDINRDGSTNLLDIAPFVALAISGDYRVEGDLDKNGIVDLLDIMPFVALVLDS